MKSTNVTIRLNDAELAMLDAVRRFKERATLNRTEMVRLLILREYKRRRTGRSKVDDTEWASDMRNGRPTTGGAQ